MSNKIYIVITTNEVEKFDSIDDAKSYVQAGYSSIRNFEEFKAIICFDEFTSSSKSVYLYDDLVEYLQNDDPEFAKRYAISSEY